MTNLRYTKRLGRVLDRCAAFACGVRCDAFARRVRDTRLACADLDPARLHRLGNLALEFDAQETMFQRGARHFDEVGQIELTAEGALGDAAVQEVAPAIVLASA